MTQQDMYLIRAAQGATLTPPAIITELTIEDTVTAFQQKFYPNPQLYKIVDAYDVYLWRALAASEQATIDLINAARPQKAGAL